MSVVICLQHVVTYKVSGIAHGAYPFLALNISCFKFLQDAPKPRAHIENRAATIRAIDNVGDEPIMFYMMFVKLLVCFMIPYSSAILCVIPCRLKHGSLLVRSVSASTWPNSWMHVVKGANDALLEKQSRLVCT